MKKPATTTPLIPEHREEIQAPYHFTQAEVSQMNVDHRASLDAIELLQDQKKAAMQDFTLRIQNRQNDERMLRNKLTSGEENRSFMAAVDFNAKRGVKRYLNSQTGDLIREEPMQPADWQLPMFTSENGKEKPAAAVKPVAAPVPPTAPGEPAKPRRGRPPKSSPVGETSVGDVLDQAAAKTKASQFPLDLGAYDDAKSLLKAFRKSAKAAGWTATQISALRDRLAEAPSFKAMLDTLRPFVTAPTE